MNEDMQTDQKAWVELDLEELKIDETLGGIVNFFSESTPFVVSGRPTTGSVFAP